MVSSAGEISWSHTPDQKLDAQNAKSSHRGATTQMMATVSGAVLLFFCLLAIAITWYLSYVGTTDALNTTSEAFRKAKAQTLSEQIAVIIRPAWTVPRQMVDRLTTGSEQDGIQVIPPTPETFSNVTQLSAYQRALAPYVNREVYMRKTNADKSIVEHNFFVGIVMVLALNENNEPATRVEDCTKAVYSSNILNNATLEDYLVDVAYLDSSLSVSDPSASQAGVSRHLRAFDHINFSLGDPIATLPTAPCSHWMASLWGGSPHLEAFYNFTWWGPYNPGVGWGNHLEGSVPIYNERRDMIGRFSAAVSMGKSITPVLQEIIGGSPVSEGGAAALYTKSGIVLGLSEAAASDGSIQAEMLEDLVSDSLTAKAIALVRAEFGEACPERQEFLTKDDILVDVTPFISTEYGLPPLPERWCQMVTLPRSNIYEPIDDAVESAIIVGISCLVGFAGAVALLGTSLFLAIRTQRRMRHENLAFDWAIVTEAEESVEKLMSPMALIRAENFLAMNRLECFEEWRDSGRIKLLDSVELVRDFKDAGNLIVFFSHQWLGKDYPDSNDNRQLRVMHEAIRHFMENEASEKCIYVWLDYVCIAQHHAESQAMAVAALPVYVSLVDRFVIVAPDALHKDTQQPVGLHTYSRRGWCRAEMLAKACSSGLQNFFVCAGEKGQMRAFQPEDMNKISLSVYEGDFTVKNDAEKLVVPVLGMYGMILKQAALNHIQPIKAHIEARKERFFPHSYKVEEDGTLQTKRLFGELVEMMEDKVFETGHSKIFAKRAIPKPLN